MAVSIAQAGLRAERQVGEDHLLTYRDFRALTHAPAEPGVPAGLPRTGSPGRTRKAAPADGPDESRHWVSSAPLDCAGREGKLDMGSIRVHEFISLDGIIDTPTWTFDYGYDPRMGQAIGELMGSCQAILLGRTTYQMSSRPGQRGRPRKTPGRPS